MHARGVVVALAGLLAGSGCAGMREYMRPTERTTAESPGGWPAAEYDLVVPSGRFGEAKVWSRGVMRTKMAGQSVTVASIGIELENTGDAPIEFDISNVRLEGVRTDARVFDTVPAAGRADARAEIPPGQVRQFEIRFVMPSGLEPQDVDAFRVRWSVQRGRETYAESTPFREFEPVPTSYASGVFGFGPYYGSFSPQPYGAGPYRPWYYKASLPGVVRAPTR